MKRVVVRAPATIANLGPGFDCLGLALAWHNEIRLERDGSEELTVTAAGEGAEQIPRDETNLTVRAAAGVLGSAAGLRVHSTNAIPFGRGFGSSAAAIVGGLLAGRALAAGSGRSGPDDLLAAATELEGHADNVAACLAGGCVIVHGIHALRLGAPSSLEAVVCVAPSALSTRAARKVLPETIGFGDAVASVGRAALLAGALATGETAALLDATEDVLHQPTRFELMPDTGRLVGALRRERIAAFLAGAGPSVAALVPAADAGAAEDAARRLAPDGWDVRRVDLDRGGASVVEGG